LPTYERSNELVQICLARQLFCHYDRNTVKNKHTIIIMVIK